jgi:hypothetical protein
MDSENHNFCLPKNKQTTDMLLSSDLEKRYMNETLYRNMGFIKRYAVISVNEVNRYSFYAPIVAKFRKRPLSYLILLGLGPKWHTDAILQVIVQQLKMHKARLHFIDPILPFSVIKSSQIA